MKTVRPQPTESEARCQAHTFVSLRQQERRFLIAAIIDGAMFCLALALGSLALVSFYVAFTY